MVEEWLSVAGVDILKILEFLKKVFASVDLKALWSEEKDIQVKVDEKLEVRSWLDFLFVVVAARLQGIGELVELIFVVL